MTRKTKRVSEDKRVLLIPEYKTLSISQAAYVAGVFDCDGYVGEQGMRMFNTDYDFIVKLQLLVGGRIHSDEKSRKGKRKICYTLQLRMGERVRVLPQIIPYMIIKKKRAEELFKKMKVSLMAKGFVV